MAALRIFEVISNKSVVVKICSPPTPLQKNSGLYIHVTVRRYRVIFNNQPDALFIQIYSVIKLYMFRATSLPIIGSFLLYIRHWEVSCRFWWPLPSRVRMELQFHPDSAWKRSSKPAWNLPVPNVQ